MKHLGKGEVESSILSCSTINHLENNDISEVCYAGVCADSRVNESCLAAKNWQGTLADMAAEDKALSDRDERYLDLSYIYRYFGSGGELLYVGITNAPVGRHTQHASKPWVGDARYIRHERVPFRRLAAALEYKAYEDERPIHNFPVKYLELLWRPAWGWYKLETGGEFRGDRVIWFDLEDWWSPTSCDQPAW